MNDSARYTTAAAIRSALGRLGAPVAVSGRYGNIHVFGYSTADAVVTERGVEILGHGYLPRGLTVCEIATKIADRATRPGGRAR